MRQFGRIESLIEIWCYSLNIINGSLLPSNYAIGKPGLAIGPVSKHLHPWELDVLARELVLNGGTRGNRTLKQWDHLATAVNHIKRLDGASFTFHINTVDMMLELHRIAHRQFPWQSGGEIPAMLRAFKVFGQAAVESIVLRELGMTTRQYMLLGIAVAGNFFKRWGMSTAQDYAVLGISRDASQAFFNRITISILELKNKTEALQSYDSNWPYSWNPLEGNPLIIMNTAYPDRVICPIPTYLTRRATSGMFYDLVKSSDFDNPFGASFQAYVGDVIQATCSLPCFTALNEQSYFVGSRRFDGADWVLSDKTGHLFIEAKTKRLTVMSRTRSDPVALEKDISILAKAVVQNYRNIVDALAGKTRWKNDGLPVFPLVLTLEDLFLFSPRVNEMLHACVVQLLDQANIPRQVTEDMPYTIASANEFEITSQVVAQVGIAPLFLKKTQPAERFWSLSPFLNSAFRLETKRVKRILFIEDWTRLTPDLSQGNTWR